MSLLSAEEKNIQAAPLGKQSAYITQYAPELLFPIPRKRKRDEINVPNPLPFFGFDTWNAYEVSWLNAKGKPQVAILQFDISCFSTHIVESKSFKLYLNSFNNTSFESEDDVKKTIERDITKTVDGEVKLTLYHLDELCGQPIEGFNGQCIDDYDVVCDTYTTNPDFIFANPDSIVSENLVSHLLKSNCLVTGQPDWGSILISYSGAEIDKANLLKYIVSFRNHNEFHEQCVERVFMDIMTRCKPESLTVEARYTRRGGLDINPARSTEQISPTKNIRMSRQ
ncbi:MAG: NADPH-dependent 7-cyano-7-deazaguanine reductase QueF [Legionellales bacterium]|nr:NADPH-dependent 7-cyano-7-deazaguanine reductase QueF [Legionellales bacterium]